MRTTFTAEKAAAIIECVAQGVPFGEAAAAAGVPRRTAFDWLYKGREDPEGLYGTFAAEVDRTRAVVVATMQSRVRMAAAKNWRAAAWWLERNSRDYSSKSVHEVSGPDGGPIQAQAVKAMTEDTAETIRRHVLGIGETGALPAQVVSVGRSDRDGHPDHPDHDDHDDHDDHHDGDGQDDQ